MDVIRRNLGFGWWSLLGWLALGLLLEAMHGFKIGWYLDVANEGRQLQLRLAHTHGTLIGLVNIAFAATFRAAETSSSRLVPAALCLRWAGILMPAGFLFGGVFLLGSDPGFAVVLVPIGGTLLFAGVLLSARSLASDRIGGGNSAGGGSVGPAPRPPERPAKRPKGNT